MKLELTNIKSWRKTTFEFGDSDCTLISGPSGQGKCLAENTMIRMANGDSTPVQSVKTGDMVMGWDSRERRVVSTATGTEEMFRVTGYSTTGKIVMKYVVNASHILTLLDSKNNPIDINVSTYLDLGGKPPFNFKGFRAEIRYPTHPVPLHPYLYGVMLRGGADNIPTRVKHSLNPILRREYGYYYSSRTGELKKVFGRRFRRNLKSLKYLFSAIDSRLNNPHVLCQEYLKNSVEIRKEVLAGFLDRNVTEITRNGELLITKTNKTLSQSVLELVNSLGGYGYTSETGLYICLTSYIPTRVVKGYNIFEKGIRISVQPVGPGVYYGFELTGDGRFCLEDYTVTHNSSILQGIEFALFGTGKNLISHGETSCSARLTIGDAVITRTKRPNRLVLQTPGGELEDAAAQAWIGRRFSARAGITPFITMTPADKLAFLEEAAFREIDIGKLKELAKNRVKTIEISLAKSQQHLQTTESFLKASEPPGSPPEGYDALVIKDVRKTEKRLKNSRVMVTKIHRSIDHYRKLLMESAGIRKEISMLETQRETLEDEIEGLEEIDLGSIRVAISHAKTRLNSASEYAEYQERLSEIQKLEGKLQETIDSQARKISELERVIDIGEKALEPQGEIVAELDKLDEYTKLVESLETLEANVAEKETITTEYDSIETRRERLLKADVIRLVCPCCDSTVVYSNGSLEIPVDTTVETNDTLESLVKLKAKLSKKLAKISMDEIRLEETNQKVLALESSIIDEATEIEYTDKLPELEAQITAGNEAKTELKILKRTTEAEISRLRTTLGELQTKNPESPPNPTEESVETLNEMIKSLNLELQSAIEADTFRRAKTAELTRVNKRLNGLSVPEEADHYTKKLEELTEMLPEHEEAVNRYTADLETLREYTEFSKREKEYSSRLEAVEDAKSILEEQEALYACAVTLRQKISDAETSTLASIIGTLNGYAAEYLNAFFPDNPIIVEILPYKETAKRGGATRKSQISTRVEYHGTEADISSLSSGERDRVILAFSLAVNQLQNSRVIMLDECTSSLDAETSNVVFSKIRETMGDRCVLIVAHQIVQGIFDDVLEI